MIRSLIRDARDVPERVLQQGNRLVEEVGRAPVEARRWLRRRLHEVRETSERNLFELNVAALEAMHTLLRRADGLPVLERVSPGAKAVLDQLERATVAPPLDGYDELNVRTIMAALRDLDHFGLLRIARYESSHKNRKTVLDAIERELGRRARLVAAA